MPAFNSGKTIKESINSVLIQTYSNFELLIIDDDSTDNTVSVVNEFTDSRIILLSNCNSKGAAGARKTGIDHSSGKYIAFLDSDDMWPAQKLMLHVSYIESNNVSFTYSDYYSFVHAPSSPTKFHTVADKISYKDLLKSCQIGCLTVLIDKKKFRDLEYDNLPKEDYAYWLKLLKQCEFGFKVPGSYAYYRLQKKSLSSNKFKEIKKQWYIIRYVEKNSLIKSIYNISTYIIYGLKKHLL
nr:glycosyltransferase family 2 protein [Buttiauxella sp. A2-C1_F]